MQRRRVVLPEPLGPITTTTSPGATESDTSRSTSTAPKRLLMPEISSIGRRPTARTSMAVEDAPLKVPAVKRQGIADAKVDRARSDKDLKRGERALDDLAARHRQFPQPDDRHQRGRFDEADAEADKGWCRQPQGLWQYDDLQQQGARHAEAARRIPLRLRQ